MSKYSNNINKYYSYDKKKEIDLLRKVNSVTLNPPNLKGSLSKFISKIFIEIKEEKKDKIKPNLVPVAAASKWLDGSVKSKISLKYQT